MTKLVKGRARYASIVWSRNLFYLKKKKKEKPQMGKSLDNFLLGITLLWIFFLQEWKICPKILLYLQSCFYSLPIIFFPIIAPINWLKNCDLNVITPTVQSEELLVLTVKWFHWCGWEVSNLNNYHSTDDTVTKLGNCTAFNFREKRAGARRISLD